MRFFLLLLLAAQFMLCATDETIIFNHVPASAFHSLLSEDTKGILLTSDEFMDLLNKGLKNEPEKQPFPYTLNYSIYSGRFIPGSSLLLLDGSLEIRLCENGPALIPFESENAFFSSLDSNGPWFETSAEIKSLAVDGSGSFLLKARVFVPVEYKNGFIRTRFRLPQFNAGAVCLTFPFPVKCGSEDLPSCEKILDLDGSAGYEFIPETRVESESISVSQEIKLELSESELLERIDYSFSCSGTDGLILSIPAGCSAEMHSSFASSSNLENSSLIISFPVRMKEGKFQILLRQNLNPGGITVQGIETESAIIESGTIYFMKNEFAPLLTGTSGLDTIESADELCYAFNQNRWCLSFLPQKYPQNLTEILDLNLYLTDQKTYFQGKLTVSSDSGFYSCGLGCDPAWNLTLVPEDSLECCFTDEGNGRLRVELPVKSKSISFQFSGERTGASTENIPVILIKEGIVKGSINLRPDPEISVSLANFSGLKFDPAGLNYQITGPYSGTLQLSREQPQITAIFVRSLLFSETVQEKITVFTEIRNNSIRSLQVSFPGHPARIRVTTEHKEISFDSSENSTLCTVTFNQSLSGAQEISFELEHNTLDAAVFSGISCPAAVTSSGFISVYSGRSSDFSIKNSGLLEIDPDEVPDCGHFRERCLASFRYGNPNYTLSVSQKEFGKNPRSAKGFINKLDLSTELSTARFFTQLCTLDLSAAGMQFLKLNLPDQSQILSAQVEGESVKAMCEEGSLLLPLSDKAEQKIELLYRSPQRGFCDLKIPFPKFKVPVVTTDFRLYLPEKYRMLGFSGMYKSQAMIHPDPILYWLIINIRLLLIPFVVIFLAVLLFNFFRTKNWRFDWSTLLLKLMLIIAVTGILAAIAVPNFTKARVKSKQKVLEATQRNNQFQEEIKSLSNAPVTQMPADAGQDREIEKKVLAEPQLEMDKKPGVKDEESQLNVQEGAAGTFSNVEQSTEQMKPVPAKPRTPMPKPETKRKGQFSLPVQFDPQGRLYSFSIDKQPEKLNIYACRNRLLSLLGMIGLLCTFFQALRLELRQNLLLLLLFLVFPMIIPTFANQLFNFAAGGVLTGMLAVKCRTPARLIPFALFFALLIFGYALSAAEYLIPSDDILNHSQDSRIYLDREQFLKLYHAAYPEDRKTEDPRPELVFSNQKYELTVSSGSAQVKYSGNILSTRPGFTKVRLRLHSLNLSSLLLDGKPAAAEGENLLLSKPGAYKLELSFSVSLASSGNDSSLNFPAVTDSTALCELDCGRFIPRFDGKAFQRDGESYFFFTEGEGFSLVLQAQDISQKTVNTETICSVEIGVNRIFGKLAGTLKNASGKISLVLPENSRVSSAGSPMFEQCNQAGRTLEISIFPGAGEEIPFSLDYEQEKKEILPLPIPVFSTIETCGRISFRTRSSEKLSFESLKNMQRIDSNDPAETVFSYSRQTPSGNLKIREKSPETETTCRVQVSISKAKIESQSDLEIRNPPALTRIKIPEGFRLIRLSGASYLENSGEIQVFRNKNPLCLTLLLESAYADSMEIWGPGLSGLTDSTLSVAVSEELEPRIIDTTGLFQKKNDTNAEFEIRSDDFRIVYEFRTRPSALDFISVCHLKLRNEGISFSGLLNFTPSISPVSELGFNLLLPETARPLIVCEEAREKSVRYEGGSFEISLKLKQPMLSPVRITVNADLKQEEDLIFPKILQDLTGREKNFLLLENDSGMELARKTCTNLEETSSIPFLPEGLSQNRIYQSYVSYGKDWDLSYTVRKIESAVLVKASVLWASLNTFMDGSGYSLNKVSYKIRNSSLQYFRLKLPRLAILWQVRVQDHSVQAARDSEENLIIPLEKTSAGSMDQMLELTYQCRQTVFPCLLSLRPPVIMEKLDIAKTFWTVTLPSDRWYLRFSGNLERAGESEGDVEYLRELVDEIRNVRSAQNSENLAVQNRARENLSILQGKLDLGYSKVTSAQIGSKGYSVLKDADEERQKLASENTGDSNQQQKMDQIFSQNLMQNQTAWSGKDQPKKQSGMEFQGFASRKRKTVEQKFEIAEGNLIKLPDNGKKFYFKKIGETPRLRATFLSHDLLRLILALLFLGAVIRFWRRKAD